MFRLLGSGVEIVKSNSWRTSINLGEQTSRIVKMIPNRSEFMRECIRRWYVANTTGHLHPTDKSRCWPYSPVGVCRLCWPDGIPSKQDWSYFCDMHREKVPNESIDKWLSSRIQEDMRPSWAIPTLIDLIPEEKLTFWQWLKKKLPWG